MNLSWVIERGTRNRFATDMMNTIAARRQVLVLPILGAGLLLRLWDIARPFIGFHMWNEVYYTTIARNFKYFGFLSLNNYNLIGGSPLTPRFGPSPFVSWLVYLSSEIFGPSEWVARLPILILGMLSLVMLYLISLELYGVEVGLLAISFASVMPGIVFFSRQVALDGPMTAFGLAALWVLLLAERRREYWLVFTSAILLGVAIFIKYTAVLFIPGLVWVWIKMIRHSSVAKRREVWLLAVAYLFVAALPAGAWLIFEGNMAGGQRALDPWSGYLNRTDEWGPTAWYLALQSIWTRTQGQVGRVLWYPLVIIGSLAFVAGRISVFVRNHLQVVLLIIPWFAQMGYPRSWFMNDAYSYPALYGTALLIALILREVLPAIQQALALSPPRSTAAACLLGTLFCISSFLDYKGIYHSWYTTATDTAYNTSQQIMNAVTPEDPFLSAKLIRATNLSHSSILADLPATLYYAQDDFVQGQAIYWWWGFSHEYDRMIEAIISRQFGFVVFAYQPPIGITEALGAGGYRRIGPAAWERLPSP